ncbi:hypothetical protein [Puia dinghuensis]|uniref:hypothetical protein n=1 Tax=Puia dinghuensis TaxID=1792502 RepID=UPI0016682A05|nr:hypothetical protein [Puia dinghuensis]
MDTILSGIITGVAISAVGGLGWMSYHQPSLATKLIVACFIVFFLLHLGTFIYRSSWRQCQSYFKKSIEDIRPSGKMRKGQLARFKARFRPVYARSTRHINTFSDHSDTRFCIVYALLFGLFLFCMVRRKKPPAVDA